MLGKRETGALESQTSVQLVGHSALAVVMLGWGRLSCYALGERPHSPRPLVGGAGASAGRRRRQASREVRHEAVAHAHLRGRAT
eukprot:686354-Pyramimonas_sp.AAC.1